MIFTITAKYSFSISTTSSAVLFSEKAVKPRISEKKTTTSRLLPPTPISFSIKSSATEVPWNFENKLLTLSRSLRPSVIWSKASAKSPTSSCERTAARAFTSKLPLETRLIISASFSIGEVSVIENKKIQKIAREIAEPATKIARRLTSRETSRIVSSEVCEIKVIPKLVFTEAPK
ncbi:hypothetical protein D3C87_1565740 [compost metagenome]